MTTAELITAAEYQLVHLGLHCVGRSSVSRSSYWSLSPDDNQPRIRLSDHAVVHAVSDCAVCVGVSFDDDVRLDGPVADCILVAVRKLVDAQIAHDIESCCDEDDAEEQAFVTDCIRKQWQHVLA